MTRLIKFEEVNMKKFSKLVVVALGIMLCFSMASCGIKDPSLEGIKAYGKLIVSTSPDFPPFEYMEGKNIDGWDIGVAEHFAKDIGVKLKVVSTEFDGILGAVDANKAHIGMAGISYSAKRAESVDFTNGVYKSSQVIVVRTESDIKTAADLKDKRVGGQRGTVGFNIADCNEDWAYDGDTLIIGKPSEAKGYDTGATAVTDLVNGKIDAVIIDINPAKKFVANNDGKVKIVMAGDKELSILDDEYAFIVKKGNKTLVDELNRLLALYKTDGTFDELDNKYFI